MSETQETTPEQMKMQALVERIAELTAEYENKIADLRVGFTMLSNQLEEARKQIAAYEEPVNAEAD